MELDLGVIQQDLITLGAKDVHSGSGTIYWKGVQGHNDIKITGSIFRHHGINIDKCGTSCLYGEGNIMEEIPTEELNALGITDLLNLQPHEKGLLRVKYGITELDLYVPEQLKGGFYGD